MNGTNVEENIRLVNIAVKVAQRKYKNPILDEGDLFQIGYIGLMDAAKRYDPSTGIKFSSFAFHRIYGSMLDELRALDWVPRQERVKERENKKELEKNPDAEKKFIPKMYMTSSLKTSSDNDIDQQETLPAENTVEKFPADGTVMAEDVVNYVFSGLTPKDRHMAEMYYVENKTLKQISEEVQKTESRICQIFKERIYETVEKRILDYTGLDYNTLEDTYSS